jgi:hypothetical protein
MVFGYQGAPKESASGRGLPRGSASGRGQPHGSASRRRQPHNGPWRRKDLPSTRSNSTRRLATCTSKRSQSINQEFRDEIRQLKWLGFSVDYDYRVICADDLRRCAGLERWPKYRDASPPIARCWRSASVFSPPQQRPAQRPADIPCCRGKITGPPLRMRCGAELSGGAAPNCRVE